MALLFLKKFCKNVKDVMKIAVMQPYFLPYIGYFQLIHAVDLFVIYDDAFYINRGWINRNRILQDDRAHFITLSLQKASQNKRINEILIQKETDRRNRTRILNIIGEAYAKSPQFGYIFPLVREIIMNEENNLSVYVENSMKILTDLLGMKKKFVRSSSIKKDRTLNGELRIIDICKLLKADQYYNLIGGASLYSRENFLMNGIELNFIHSKEITYSQLRNDFIPSLSIVDILMFNSKDDVKRIIEQYE
jgi:hypothetical protein